MSDTQSQTVAFVRETQIRLPPPATETGVIKWARENLFSGWVNSILTILSIYFVVKFTIDVYPWFANGVWGTANLAECREILAGTRCLFLGSSGPLGPDDLWHRLSR